MAKDPKNLEEAREIALKLVADFAPASMRESSKHTLVKAITYALADCKEQTIEAVRADIRKALGVEEMRKKLLYGN